MPPRKKPEQQYIRNVRFVPVSVRLNAGRKFDLRPRGQRGDTVPVSADEMNDEIFLGNLDVLFEVIPASEAHEVIRKQTTNQRKMHPALAQMRNEYGQEYKKGVVMGENTPEQSFDVGSVDEQGNITRTTVQEVPENVQEGPEAGLAGLKVTRSTTNINPTQKD
jgi:hypothetical protein